MRKLFPAIASAALIGGMVHLSGAAVAKTACARGAKTCARATTAKPGKPVATKPATAAPVATPVTPTAQVTTGPKPGSASATGFVGEAVQGDFATAMLDTHNAERKRFGVAPLVWDAKLATAAAAWADHLARTDTFDHADTPDDQGENLWMGSRKSFTYAEMVADWISEKSMYRRGRFPAVSTTPNWQDVGHYTQLVWYNTKRLGCAVASNAANDFLVCRYGPPGNWVGEFADGRAP